MGRLGEGRGRGGGERGRGWGEGKKKDKGVFSVGRRARLGGPSERRKTKGVGLKRWSTGGFIRAVAAAPGHTTTGSAWATREGGTRGRWVGQGDAAREQITELKGNGGPGGGLTT
jgi:hypothetical protein